MDGPEPSTKNSGEATVAAPAKINWILNVGGLRPDGFHEIESLASTVSLCDALRVSSAAGNGFVLTCDEPSIPVDERNLVWRAWSAMSQACGRRERLRVAVQKRIPAGGGLGGGSSDAAAMLHELDRRWSLGWTADQLVPIAAGIGSDVPLFLLGGTVIVRGRGEVVGPARLDWAGWIVLACPPIGVSTRAVYERWRPETAPQPGDVDGFLALGRSDGVTLMQAAGNMLEPAAFGVEPELAGLGERLTAIARRPVRLCGTGSSFFTAFDTSAEADEFAGRVRTELEIQAHLVQLMRAPGDSGGNDHGDQ